MAEDITHRRNTGANQQDGDGIDRAKGSLVSWIRLLTLATDKTLMGVTPDLRAGISHIPRTLQTRRDRHPSR